MAKNKFQEVIFTLLMSVFMVMPMETYNGYFRDGAVTLNGFFITLQEMTYIVPIVFVLSFFIFDPLTSRLLSHQPGYETAHPLLLIYVRAIMTVSTMCPMMSFVATLLFKHPTPMTIVPIWLKTVAMNFPCAMFVQVCYAGPLTRYVFGKLFLR